MLRSALPVASVALFFGLTAYLEVCRPTGHQEGGHVSCRTMKDHRSLIAGVVALAASAG
jgi:hypothetical protein